MTVIEHKVLNQPNGRRLQQEILLTPNPAALDSNMAGMVQHEYYFENLAANGKGLLGKEFKNLSRKVLEISKPGKLILLQSAK